MVAFKVLPHCLQVTDWLDYILGKSEQPPSFMRRNGPPERKRKKKAGERDTSGGSSRPTGAMGQLQQYTHSKAGSGGRSPSLVRWGLWVDLCVPSSHMHHAAQSCEIATSTSDTPSTS